MNSGCFESLVYMIYQFCEFEVEEKTASRIISRFLSSIFAWVAMMFANVGDSREEVGLRV